jgi:hypothetical protein
MAMIIYLHLPKTGGTTFNHILSDNFELLLRLYERDSFRAFLEMSHRERTSFPAATGHMPYGIHHYLNVPCQYIVFLRNPVDHLISYYHHVLRTPANSWHERASKMTLQEFAESDVWPFNDNPQTRQMGVYDWQYAPKGGTNWVNSPEPCDEHLLAESKSNLDRCDFVGLFDHLEESIRLACGRLGLKCDQVPRLNVTEHRPAVDDLDPSLRKIIEERRRFDVALYEHARRRAGVLSAP